MYQVKPISNTDMTIIETIKERAQALFPRMTEYRRHLHRYPELSFKEYNTAAYIQGILESCHIPYTKGVAGTGIVALLEGKRPEKKCIALRADMDALPITEQNEVPYKSAHEGIMHACGHDVHTACLLGAMQILNGLRDHFEGTVKLIFQPGEEQSPGGASLMIADGVLEQPAVDGIIGLHVYPELPAGYLGFRSGEYMASSDEIFITVKGRGGHAALPHKCIDPIVIAANIIVSLQQLVSRKSNALVPTVLSFGKIQGGHTNNVIPDEVHLEGTLRTFDEPWRQEALQQIRTIAAHTAAAYGGEAVVHFPPGYPSLFNDHGFTKYLQGAAADLLGKEHITELDRRMTAEDFSFYTQQVKGCFFRLGTNKDHTSFTRPVHNASFDVDESAMITGAQAMAYLAYKALEE